MSMLLSRAIIGKEAIHKDTGHLYHVIDLVKIKGPGMWYDGVLYCSKTFGASEEKYVRREDDFVEKFTVQP